MERDLLITLAACLAAYAGLGVGCGLIWILLRIREWFRPSEPEPIWYVYQTHIEKSTRVHRDH